MDVLVFSFFPQSQEIFLKQAVIAHEWSQPLGPLIPGLSLLSLLHKTLYCVQWKALLDPFQLHQVHFH